MPLNISYKVSGKKLLKLTLFEHAFVWLVTTSFLLSVDIFKNMMLIEGLKPSNRFSSCEKATLLGKTTKKAITQ